MIEYKNDTNKNCLQHYLYPMWERVIGGSVWFACKVKSKLTK